jgi:hypothetical protein
LEDDSDLFYLGKMAGNKNNPQKQTNRNDKVAHEGIIADSS